LVGLNEPPLYIIQVFCPVNNEETFYFLLLDIGVSEVYYYHFGETVKFFKRNSAKKKKPPDFSRGF